MNIDELNRLEKEFEQEHEEQARIGWPLSFTMGAFAEVTKHMSKPAYHELGGVAHDAQLAYLSETAGAYSNYLAQEAAAGSDDEKADTWRRHLDATQASRQRLRLRVWAGVLRALDSSQTDPPEGESPEREESRG